MKRKILSALMCLTLAFSLTGCFSDNEVSSIPPEPTTTIAPAATPEVDTVPSESSLLDNERSNLSSESSAESMGLDAYAKTIKDTYAADYIPDRKLSDTEILDKLKLSPEMYEDIYAEGSTLEENPDIFVAVKAKSGKETEVESKLKEYKESLLANTAYKANSDKIKASQVFTNGNHVFLILLGANEFTDGGDNLGERFATEMQKGADAIKKMFQ